MHFVPLHVRMHVDVYACLCACVVCERIATCARYLCTLVYSYVLMHMCYVCTYMCTYTRVCLMYESMSVQMQGKLLAVCVQEYIYIYICNYDMCLCNELPFASLGVKPCVPFFLCILAAYTIYRKQS